VKRVVVIASGETERKALPSLLAHLAEESILLSDVRTPPHHRKLDAPMAARLVAAAHWSSIPRPDKFVVLVDADGQDPLAIAPAMQRELAGLCQVISIPILVTAAKWHLEAWFFADGPGLRAFLARDLGNVDGSNPDAIANPKAHLKNLFAQTYTARIAGLIAGALSAVAIRQTSPSFRRFEAAIRNGGTEE